ncbi:hypothetical protein AK812_SmicGene35905 [Symbiodinium microadriaticum]|uniref:Uncharacterized protein n=1 Tax=Symbiodinium microadriaticum TaxID=2951 RepID=A0A1Q9CK85_SYMMI|nr:hypothetical protein AK812_SmicGene35905 [Symbiodinium microadriaticum]CAE7331893.1 unnamed protein product [Symbiodinium sp. KB8]CAE7654070.1 unnamed protein product [Symbiodinium microadriaticum]
MKGPRRPTPASLQTHAEPVSEVPQAAESIRQAEALLICAGGLLDLPEGKDAGVFQRPPLSTLAGSLEYGIPAPGVCSPLRELWREHMQADSASLFDSDPGLAWAFWGFWSRRYLEMQPDEGCRSLASWGRSMKQGFFCVTSTVDGHWARVVGDERVWELRGSVSFLQRVDGTSKIWRVGEGHGAAQQLLSGARQSFAAAASSLASLLGAGPEPKSDWEGEELPGTLPLELPPHFDLQPGEAVEVRTLEAVENSSTYEWTPWKRAVAAGSFGIVSPSGAPVAAHAVRRPKGPDLLRVAGELPRDPADSSCLARPNVDMHSDSKFVSWRCDRQEQAYFQWRSSLPRSCRLVVVEVGTWKSPAKLLDPADFPCATLLRLGVSGRVPEIWKGRCWRVAGDWSAALRQLSDSLGPSELRAGASVESTPRASASVQGMAEAQTAEVSALTSVGSVTGSEKEEKRPAYIDTKRKKSKAGKDGGLNWDDIPEYDIDEEDALDKVMNFAAGVYTRAAGAVEAMQPDSQSDEGKESDHSEVGGDGDRSEEGGEADSRSSVAPSGPSSKRQSRQSGGAAE